MVAHSATLEMNERVVAYRRAGRAILHLGFGEAGLPPLPELVDLLCSSATDTRYGPVAGSEAARTAAAGYWERRGLPTSPDQIMFAPGSKALLYAALSVIEGDLILPVPSWVTYAAQASLTGKRVVGVPIAEGHGGVPDVERLGSTIARARAEGADPRILLLTLPDNPTGTLAPSPIVERLCEIAERENLVILSDEIYRDLVHDEGDFVSPAHYSPERTLVTSGLSKNLALGGWRIGHLRTPNGPAGRAWYAALLGVASEIWSSMSSPMDPVAAFALDEPAAVSARVAASRRLHATVARAVGERFQSAGATLRKPQAGFYLYPDFDAFRDQFRRLGLYTSADVSTYLLDQHGLAMLPGVSFGEPPEALRFRAATSLLYGTGDERLEALNSPNPLRLPWVEQSMTQLDAVLTAVRGLRG